MSSLNPETNDPAAIGLPLTYTPDTRGTRGCRARSTNLSMDPFLET
jgi:hypothetical protein